MAGFGMAGFGMTGFRMLLTALEMELSSQVLPFPDWVFTALHKYPGLPF